MNAEIIAVGSELLTQQRVDTNSLFIAQELNALGIEVVMKSVVGDDPERLAAMIRATLARTDVLILTGGLGPTEDDLTRDAVAAALGRELTFSHEAFDVVVARFALLKREMAENNRRQAMVVDGAQVLPNPNGTAPGLWVEENGRVLMLLPGPPREMQPMLTAQCLPRLQKILPPLVIRARCYRVAGMGEADLDAAIAPVYTQYANPVTTVLADLGDIQVHLRARCATADEAESLLAEVGARIEAVLGERIYSNDGQPLEAVVGRMLKARGETVSVAESCTGGLVAERLTSIPGSSAYFLGGFLAYTNEMKTALLGVHNVVLERHTAVSEQVAVIMAANCRKRTGSTYGLAVTGYAGPDGGTPEDPVGTVYIGLAGPDGIDAQRLFWGGERHRIRRMASQTALDLLRKKLA